MRSYFYLRSLEDLVSISTATGNDNEASGYKVTIVTFIIKRSYAVTAFIKATTEQLGWRRQE